MIGNLTDKGQNEKGVWVARIDDVPFDCLPITYPYLAQVQKGMQVECEIDNENRIRKIRPAQKPAAHTEGFDTAARMKEIKPDPVPKELEEITDIVAQPHPVHVALKYTSDEISLLRNVIAKGCTEPEFKLLMYMANTYGLDPLLKQIWAVKRGGENAPALIFVGRDGMLAIAHRSGQFDGMQSGVVYEGEGKEKKPVSAWCEIWRKDVSHSFKSEVLFSEYNTGFSVWKTNPSAMIIKVVESVGLRKAFSVSGVYSPEEISERA